MKGYLALEDGSIFEGVSCGVQGKREGEVVFNTGMTGYQEVLTDPSYFGQIVTMTYPLIGNYGVNSEDCQSDRPKLRGYVVREACRQPSSWRMQGDLVSYLRENDIVAVEGIDTRALTRRIRKKGTMMGVIASGDWDPVSLSAEAAEAQIEGRSLVPSVSTKEPVVLGSEGKTVVIMDFGVKSSIVKSILSLGCRAVVVPAETPAVEVLAYRPAGVVLSNGPGDPQDAGYAAYAVQKLIGNVPVFGVCLGHQLLAMAFGAETFKLPFGHRGSNHPVKDLDTGRVYITSQNHGFAVKAETIGQELRVSHSNLNDGTVEGLRHKTLPVFSVQYHPEASPGPMDSFYLFQEFAGLIQ